MSESRTPPWRLSLIWRCGLRCTAIALLVVSFLFEAASELICPNPFDN